MTLSLITFTLASYKQPEDLVSPAAGILNS
jgi:hypothetical protein